MDSKDPHLMNQASQIWAMLDDMAESNPSSYRKFIDKHLKEGREFNAPPKPHMCVQTCVTSNWHPVFVNFCSWGKITKPKDEDSPIPVFGSKLIDFVDKAGDECTLVHVAFHPDILEQFGANCPSKAEQDSLIQLALNYIEDQHSMKLSRNYYIIDAKFKGDINSIKSDFGISKSSIESDFEKLTRSFGPVADLATKDPSLLVKLAAGDDEDSGITPASSSGEINLDTPLAHPKIINEPKVETKADKKLIEEITTEPMYTMDNVDGCLVIKVELSEVTNVSECLLDVTKNTMEMTALNYHLLLDLPQDVSQEEVRAKYSKRKRQLTVTLPLMA